MGKNWVRLLLERPAWLNSRISELFILLNTLLIPIGDWIRQTILFESHFSAYGEIHVFWSSKWTRGKYKIQNNPYKFTFLITLLSALTKLLTATNDFSSWIEDICDFISFNLLYTCFVHFTKEPLPASFCAFFHMLRSTVVFFLLFLVFIIFFFFFTKARRQQLSRAVFWTLY